MKHDSRRLSISIVTLLLLGYLAWVATPFDAAIKVYDNVGLPKDRIDQLVAHARDVGSFPKSTVAKLTREGRWTPWNRAVLFISISGTPETVRVMAGFNGGLLYGGGRTFGAKWNGTGWVFTDTRSWVS